MFYKLIKYEQIITVKKFGKNSVKSTVKIEQKDLKNRPNEHDEGKNKSLTFIMLALS